MSTRTRIGKHTERKEEQIPTPNILSATTKEGKEITFNLEEQLKYWGDFYQEENIDWVSLPDTINLTQDQQEAMKKLMEQGFDKMIIIPENLVDEPTITTDTTTGKPTAISNPHYAKLHQLMSKGYVETYQGGNYREDGSFKGSKDKTTKLRIILTKDIQNLEDDLLFKETITKSIEDLKADPRFNQYTGLSESSYLIYQRDYFKRTGKHVDDKVWTWLPESTRQLSGRMSSAGWDPSGGQLSFNSDARDDRFGGLGCRLAFCGFGDYFALGRKRRRVCDIAWAPRYGGDRCFAFVAHCFD